MSVAWSLFVARNEKTQVIPPYKNTTLRSSPTATLTNVYLSSHQGHPYPPYIFCCYRAPGPPSGKENQNTPHYTAKILHISMLDCLCWLICFMSKINQLCLSASIHCYSPTPENVLEDNKWVYNMVDTEERVNRVFT